MQKPEIEGYELFKKQGEGTFGEAYRAVWGGQLECCVKVLRPESIHAPYLSWCLERLSELPKHPGILAIYGYQLAKQPIYVTTAWHSPEQDGARTLESYKGNMHPANVCRTLKATAEGMKWLHSHSIIHTGLTARNVMVLGENFEDVRIMDVGQGRIGPEQIADWISHLPYYAPERCRGEAPQGERSGEAWDIYSFGAVAYRLLTGQFPRAAARLEREAKHAASALALEDLAKQLEREAKIKWPGQPQSTGEENLRVIVERCLENEPSMRYQHMNEILSDLSTLDFAEPDRVAAPAAETFHEVAREEPEPHAPQPEPSRMESPGPPSLTDIPVQEIPPPPGPESEDLSGMEEEHTPAPLLGRSHALRMVDEDDDSPESSFTPSQKPAASPMWKVAAIGLGLSTAAAAVFGYLQISGKESADKSAREAKELAEKAQSASQAAAAAAAKDRALAKRKEEEAAKAVATQKQDRENLRQTQEVADRLLSSLLDQRPSDEQAMDEWRQSLSKVAIHCKSFIEKFKDEPALKESCARSRWHLAGIRLALGETDVAAKLLEEAARDVDAIAAATAGNPESAAEWTLLMGRIQNRRGQIAVRLNNAAEAAQYLAQSTKAYETWLQSHPDDPLASRELAQTCLLEGKALAAKGDATGALKRFDRGTELLARVEVSGNTRDEDRFLAADSHLESARAHVTLKEGKQALEACRQAMEPLIEYDGKNPQSVPCRERMAEGYALMGRILSTEGTALDSSKAFTASIRLLLDLVGENPAQESYQFELGRCYGEAARLIRAANKPQDALQAAQSAVDFLRRLTEKNQLDVRYRLQLTQETVTLAELHEDVSGWAASSQHARAALVLIDELLADRDLSAEDRKLCLRHRARAYGSLGAAADKMKKKDDAIAAYSKALETWQQLAEGGSVDEATARSLAWTQEQLKRLKPGS